MRRASLDQDAGGLEAAGPSAAGRFAFAQTSQRVALPIGTAGGSVSVVFGSGTASRAEWAQARPVQRAFRAVAPGTSTDQQA
jgi:hypothetical protein